ncbi:MAG: ribosomal protein S18-alanine N-acetyltransferase [Culicoidibacterales bacterium]
MAFKVRMMTEQDVVSVAAIEEATFPHPFTVNDFVKGLKNPQAQYFVIEQYEDIIGEVQSVISAYCGVNYFDPQRVEIATLAVEKKYRREGQAKFLLEMVLRFLQASKVEEVTLEVRPSNTPAIALYQSFGFEQVAVRKNYYQSPSEDAYLLQKKLS